MHGVIAVHGVGEHKRGEFLATVCNGLADALESSRDDGGVPQVRRHMDVSQHPAAARIEITAPDGVPATWYFLEAHWQNALVAPAAGAVFSWALRHVYQWMVQAATQLPDPSNHRGYESGDGDYAPGFFTKVGYVFELLGALLLRSIALTFGLLLLFVFDFVYFVQRIPGVNPFHWLRSAQQLMHKLDPFLSESLGDTKRYMDHGMWAASVRGVVEQTFIQMLEDDEIEDITIVAHSLGCVIMYDAMSEGSVLAKIIQSRRAQGKPDKKTTFVTLGSAINQFFDGVSRSGAETRRRLLRPLDAAIIGEPELDPAAARNRFFWLDIVSRFDPVPLGQTMDDRWVATARIRLDQIKRRKVINLDNPFRDHSFYFVNRSLVLPRIARAINGGADYPWPAAGITAAKRRDHISRVNSLSTMRLVMVGLVGAILLLTVVLDLSGNDPGFDADYLAVGGGAALVSYYAYEKLRRRLFARIS